MNVFNNTIQQNDLSHTKNIIQQVTNTYSTIICNPAISRLRGFNKHGVNSVLGASLMKWPSVMLPLFNTLESAMDQRFGRAAYFIVMDIDNMSFEPIDNGAAASSGGAGITSAQTVVDKGVSSIITGNIGPNAMNVLKTAQIDIFKGSPVSIAENVEKFRKGLIEKIDTAVPQHFGMGFSGGRK